MHLIPRTKNRELSRFQREMMDIWERFFGDAESRFFGAGEWLPSIDLSETDNEVQIKAELPGLKKEDIQVDITGNLLTISGEKKEEKEEERGNYHSKERFFGKFERRMRLPTEVKSEEIKAVYKDGVLSITAPKIEVSPKKQIEIKDQ